MVKIQICVILIFLFSEQIPLFYNHHLQIAMQSQQNIDDEIYSRDERLKDDMITKTYYIIKKMNQTQKFQKAKAHIVDALKYKHPRHQSQALNTPQLFKVLYFVQSSELWEWILFVSGWIFFCLAALDNESYATKIGMQSSILLVFWIDTVILMYCKTFDKFNNKSQYSTFFVFKVFMLLLMTIDLIVFITLPCYDSRPIRPFRILRCFVPLLFDAEMRKSLLSLASAYKDVLVYFIFFASIIIGYALLGNRALTFDPNYKDPLFPQNVDPYKTNYLDLSRMIFLVYVTATYDAYPDNQLLIIQNSEINYLYYICFIFANMFLFSSIPGSLIYLKFRDTRSKILLVDEIKQQHSLLLAFVTLAETDTNLSIEKLIKFLLFLYKYKIRYVQYITDICLKIDDNNSRSIQVNEFMQLSKILLQNSAMLPPTFQDIQIWIKFRKFMNKKFHLKQIVKHFVFELIVSIIIILSFINAIFFMYNNSPLVETFDDIFIWIFFVELIVRIVAFGPELFFMDRWNYVDTFLVAFGLAFYFVPSRTNADGIVRMSRIFRLASLLRLVSHSNYLRRVRFEVWMKLRNIFSILLEIMPIILKFMHMFAFFFYIYVIFGMEVFYNFYGTKGAPAYNQYIQFGNFASFTKGMYVMVQILTEAGWSMVTFDHCWRAPEYFGYITLFFCLCHITIVYMIATLIKGIFWEVFITVNKIFQDLHEEQEMEITKEEQLSRKAQEINDINEAIQDNVYLQPNTIMKRELVENKFDQEIFKKLIKIYEQDVTSNKKIRSKKNILTHLILDDIENRSNKNLNIDQLRSSRSQKSENQDESKKKKIQLNEIEEMEEEDFQTELSEMLEKLVVNPLIKYSELVVSPRLFVEYLQSKLKFPQEFVRDGEFKMHLSPLYNQQSMYCHIYEMHSLLRIDPSKREQKALIIKNLIEENILTEEHGEKLVRKKLQEKVFNIDTNGTLRKLFLSNTNQDLIKKFQCEYFSDLYGYSFKRINKITLQPLLKFQATLTYSLRNIMRYPQINTTEFFEMITHIEDRISNKLLQRGSLFKFVYKLDCEGDIWFSIEYKHSMEMKIHFIKTGIWCYHKEMHEKDVMYGRDIFNWVVNDESSKANCEQYIKRFFQSFEGLAFSLLDEQRFFEGDPRDYIYDLYIQHFNVQKTTRFKTKKLQISKIMVVILSKEELRSDVGMDRIKYSLTDILDKKQVIKKNVDFKFDESDKQTFDKLKNLSAIEVDKIVDSEGLPFSYVINLMKELSEIITINAENFVYQIEKVLNEEYQEMREEFKNK